MRRTWEDQQQLQNNNNYKNKRPNPSTPTGSTSAATDARFEVVQVGPASVSNDFQELAEEDLRTGELYGLVASLVILVLVFGALVAALVPVVLALVAIAVTVGLITLLDRSSACRSSS